MTMDQHAPDPKAFHPGPRPERALTRSLQNRNYRRYLLGHGLSNTGMWVQQTAELWLILQLTGSGAAVGMHSILRFGPVLLFGAQAGLVCDRVNRRRLLIATQILHAVGATTIATVAWLGRPSLLLVYAVVLGQGAVNAVDNPLRRAFVRDLVSDDHLANAVSLQSSVATLTRAVGPAVAGVLIAQVGLEWCFTINALSYAAVLVVLVTLERERMRPQVVPPRGPRQLRAGFAYSWRHSRIREALVLSFVVGMFGWNWTILVPFYATDELGGDAALYGMLVSTLSVGAFAGALMTARLTHVARRYLIGSSTVLVLALLIVASGVGVPMAVAGLVLLGLTSTAAIVGAQARIQTNVRDAMTGRVLALFSVAFVGSKPLGGLLAGWLTDLGGSRLAFVTNAGAIAVALVVMQLAKYRRGDEHERPAGVAAHVTNPVGRSEDPR